MGAAAVASQLVDDAALLAGNGGVVHQDRLARAAKVPAVCARPRTILGRTKSVSDVTPIVSTVSAAIAAGAALATLIVAFLTLREGRSTIAELKKLATEAAKETAAQERLVGVSRTTALMQHAVFTEAQAAREVEALVRVRVALAEVAYATQRVMGESHPPILFYGARQTLRAALVGVSNAERRLPICSRIATDASIVNARQNELLADTEVDKELDEARGQLIDATMAANAAMNRLND